MMFDRATGLDSLAHVRHGFFGRSGGVSEGPFASLNVSLRNADLRERALENRHRIAARFGKSAEDLSIARQVHGTDCVRLDRSLGPDGSVEADALMTTTPGVILGVTTADCAPILFADRESRVIAAAHAGWGGALRGVSDATVKAMVGAGASRERIIAAIGPCIASASYEIGEEFEAAFLADDTANGRFFSDHGQSRHFDLRAYLTERLRQAGIGEVLHVERDTYAEPEQFFSYRRTTHEGGGPFGLQVSAIMLLPVD
ncbi:MAG: peptidoglycan editing factor PgeF [Geminicoccaceae bacterium]